MMAQFMMDLKSEHRTSPSLYPPSSPKMLENYRPDSTDSGVLDLSKRRDSVDTRRTPSPYNSFSEGGSPPFQNSSPINSTNALLMNYHAIQRHHRELSPKAAMPYESPNHLDQLRHPLPIGFLPTQGFPIIPKQENLQHRPEIASYLLQSGAIPPQHQFPHSPIHPARESDSLSESSSEGQLIGSSTKLPQIKLPSETSSNASGTYPMVVGRDGKLARPFKAYPRDPLSLATGFMASGSILDANSAEKYNMFRKRMLEQIHAANGGQPTVSNPKMRRLNKSLSDASETESVTAPESIDTQPPPSKQSMDDATPNECSSSKPCEEQQSNGATTMTTANERNGMVKDSAYYERRKKNNAAAKKSRDRRRIKEDEIAIRAAFLERENIELKFELAAARKQLALYGVATGHAGSP